MEIGEKIKTLRTINNLTQEELASRCELTKGFLSQLERDLASPSISTLKDICEVLGVSMSEFFADTDEEQAVYTESDFFVDKQDNCTITWIVPNAQARNMEPILLRLPPQGKSPVLEPHEGEEFGFVLSGQITLINGDNRKVVKKGQSFYLDGSRSHYFLNESKQPAEYIWVSTPPLF